MYRILFAPLWIRDTPLFPLIACHCIQLPLFYLFLPIYDLHKKFLLPLIPIWRVVAHTDERVKEIKAKSIQNPFNSIYTNYHGIPISYHRVVGFSFSYLSSL